MVIHQAETEASIKECLEDRWYTLENPTLLNHMFLKVHIAGEMSLYKTQILTTTLILHNWITEQGLTIL